MSLPDIKNAIKTNLDELVVSGTLAAATISDIKQNPLNTNTARYPHAYLMPPAMESEVLDNRTNIRTYTFDIMVLWNAKNLASTTEIESNIEAILDKFDNDPTLSGTAMAGVLPVSSSPQPFQHNGQDLIMAVIQIAAKQQVALTFS